jgi:pimeloyl-ACP methyl ester carboxylesterase
MKGGAMPRNHQPGEVGAWADADAEREFRAVEAEARAELWAEALDDITVDTQHGSTHLYHRPGTGVPAVLVPGLGAPALMWRPELVAGLGARPVYLLDTIGDVGPSVQRVPLDALADVAVWLDDVWAALGLDRVDLVGASYGGWMALNQAQRSPARLRSIAVVEPVGLADLDKRRFLLWGIACGFASIAPDPIRRRAAVRLRQGALTDARARRLGRLAYTKHRFHLPRPRLLTDDELASVTTPALVLLGEKSEVHRSARALERARAGLAGAEVELVPGAGHSLPVDQAELVGQRLATFLDGLARAADPDGRTGGV